MTKTKTPMATHEDDGSTLRVPLGNRPGYFATIDAADLSRLHDWGYRGGWFANSNGNRRQYVRTSGQPGDPTLVQVSRLITGAGPRQIVRHRDGDRLNMTRRNLEVISRASRRV
ncbi:hypothetical protein [Caulobacter sp. DWR2-3-1b2]|uniref:hypothetical protein n=1 Tax=unclassified Caulobacter TaxID=2648921 RepID=UPI003CE9A115